MCPENKKGYIQFGARKLEETQKEIKYVKPEEAEPRWHKGPGKPDLVMPKAGAGAHGKHYY